MHATVWRYNEAKVWVECSRLAGASERRHHASNLATVLCLRSLEASGGVALELGIERGPNQQCDGSCVDASCVANDGMMNPTSRGCAKRQAASQTPSRLRPSPVSRIGQCEQPTRCRATVTRSCGCRGKRVTKLTFMVREATRLKLKCPTVEAKRRQPELTEIHTTVGKTKSHVVGRMAP